MRKIYKNIPENIENLTKYMIDNVIIFLKKLPKMFIELMVDMFKGILSFALEPFKKFIDYVNNTIDKIKRLVGL